MQITDHRIFCGTHCDQTTDAEKVERVVRLEVYGDETNELLEGSYKWEIVYLKITAIYK